MGQIVVDIMANTRQFQRNMSEVQKTMQKVGKKMQDIGKKMTATITLPLVALGGGILKIGADFEKAMSEVQAISGATGKQLESLTKKAKEMGATTKFSAKESAQAMKFMALAGWDTTQIIDGLSGVMDLAAASGEDLARVSDILTDSMTAFGMQASQASEFADLLATTSSKSNTNVTMLGEAFSYAAPIAGALGASAKDTALALGLMANAGIKASSAGTAMRTMLTNLAAPSKAVKDSFNELRIGIIKNEDGTLDLEKNILSLREAFKSLTPAQKAFHAENIAGRFGMAGLLAVVNASETDFNKLNNALNNSSGVAKKMAEIMGDNLWGEFKKLMSAIEGVAIQLSTILIPIMRNLVENYIAPAVEWFSNLSAESQKMALIIGAVAAAIGPLLIIVGALATALSAITVPMLIIIGKVALVISALVALGVIFKNLYNTNEKFRDTVKKAWGSISKTVTKVAKSIWGTLVTLFDTLTALWEQFGTPISAVLGAALDTVIHVFKAIGDIISGAFDTINGTLQIFLGLFTGNWRKAWEGIINITKGALKIINGMLKALGLDIEFQISNLEELQNMGKKKPKPFDVVALAEKVEMEQGIHPSQLKAYEKQTKKSTSNIQDLLDSINFDSIDDTGTKAFDKLNNATQRYIDTLKSQIDTFKTAFGIFDKPMIEKISGERLLVRMEAQAKLFEKWQKALDVVKSKLGANSKLFQTIAQQGPQAAGQVIGLAGLSTAQLQQAEASFATRGNIATDVATGLVGQQIRQEQSAPTVNLNGGVYVGDMAELANLIAKEMKLANAY